MKCKCTLSFKMPNYQFIKDNFYEYRMFEHEETGINLYTVYTEEDSFTFVENSFLLKFSDVQKLRENKIEDLLRQITTEQFLKFKN